jgi:hypothetical protein
MRRRDRACFSVWVFSLTLPVLAGTFLTGPPRQGRIAQDQPQGHEEVTAKDFNGDGYIDTLKSSSDGGSGFGGDSVTLRDGKSGESYTYTTLGSYGEILRFIPFDDRLLEPGSRGFKEALERALFRDIGPGALEGSLAWLLDAYASSEAPSGEGLFSQKLHFKPRWTEGPASVPDSYFIVTTDASLFRRLPVSLEGNPEFDQKHHQGWLVYYAHNHQGLEEVASSGDVRVFQSAHGVALSEEGRFCWVFVNDEILTNGPDKLRWPSIKKVALADGIVFIHHVGREEHLFLVDYRAGVAGRLKKTIFPVTEGDFAVRDGRLFIGRGAGPLSLSVDIIKEGLK